MDAEKKDDHLRFRTTKNEAIQRKRSRCDENVSQLTLNSLTLECLITELQVILGDLNFWVFFCLWF
mgnify:CR=1 FL=1